MTPPFPELSDRARDIFRLVVQSYLDSGSAGRIADDRAAVRPQPVARVDPWGDAGPGGSRAARRTAYQRGADADRRRPAPVRRRHDARGRAVGARARGDRTRARRVRGPVEEAIAATTAALSGLSACAGLVLVPRREPRLRQFSFASLGGDRALAVLVGDDGSIENRVIDLPPGLAPGALEMAANYLTARTAGPDAGRGAARASPPRSPGERAELDATTAHARRRAASRCGARTAAAARC